LINIPTENTECYKVLFPSMSRIKRCDSPLYSNVIIYSSQGMGKTETIKAFVHKARQKYGEENVNAVISDGNIPYLLLEIDDKPIQLLCCDDLTLQRVDRQALEDFYKVRHLAQARGIEKGYIITVLALHDFFAIPKHLRSYFDFLVVLNPPTNRFDRTFLESYITKPIMKKLEELQRLKRVQDKYKAYKAFWFLGKCGFIKTKYVPDTQIKEAKGWYYIEEQVAARVSLKQRIKNTLSNLRRDIKTVQFWKHCIAHLPENICACIAFSSIAVFIGWILIIGLMLLYAYITQIWRYVFGILFSM